MLKEWSYLDTFDMLAPRYDHPVRIGTVRRWARRANLQAVTAEYSEQGIVLRATAPPADAAAGKAAPAG
jgi:hypothetical protein